MVNQKEHGNWMVSVAFTSSRSWVQAGSCSNFPKGILGDFRLNGNLNILHGDLRKMWMVSSLGLPHFWRTT